MKNKLLVEELNRFNSIVNYDPKNPMINEQTVVPGKGSTTQKEVVLGKDGIAQKIVDKIKPDLPLDDTSGDIESILLLQKTLVALGTLKKNYGLDKDGVDGDFGNDTKVALKATIGSTELSNSNIDNFTEVLETNETKISNVLTDYQDFIERYKKMGGVSPDKLEICKKGSDKYYPDLPYVLKRKRCVTKKDMAIAIDKTFPDLNILGKSAILSVMIKEQGTGDKICGPNYNYSGIQTDSGKWGEGKDEKISGMFCSIDAEGVRSFASFDTLEGGVSFMKKSFDDKDWFIKLLKDVNEDEVEKVGFDLEKVSEKNAGIWQTSWNLKLSDEAYENFKKYGYNPKIKNATFSDSRGIYKKSVDVFTTDELSLHKSNIEYFRSPEKIQKSLGSMSTFFKNAFDIFKEIKR
jgi:hypothetical protein